MYPGFRKCASPFTDINSFNPLSHCRWVIIGSQRGERTLSHGLKVTKFELEPWWASQVQVQDSQAYIKRTCSRKPSWWVYQTVVCWLSSLPLPDTRNPLSSALLRAWHPRLHHRLPGFLWTLAAPLVQPTWDSSNRPEGGKREDRVFLCLPSPCFCFGCVAMAESSIMQFPPLCQLSWALANTKPSPCSFRPEAVMSPHAVHLWMPQSPFLAPLTVHTLSQRASPLNYLQSKLSE